MRLYTGNRSRQAGVTVIELMVTLSIMVILLTVAVPGMKDVIAETRRVASINQLMGALNLARNEAIKRGVRVTLCKTADPLARVPSCDLSAAWSAGWIVFPDHTHVAGNRLGVIDGADAILKVFQVSDGIAIATGGNFAGGMFYEPNGTSGGITARGSRTIFNDTFKIDAAGERVCLVVNTTGRSVVRRQGQEPCT
jgi:type IV fimbrial biogenesis protein FimT